MVFLKREEAKAEKYRMALDAIFLIAQESHEQNENIDIILARKHDESLTEISRCSEEALADTEQIE